MALPATADDPVLVTAQARATTHSFDRAGRLSQSIAEACLMQSLLSECVMTCEAHHVSKYLNTHRLRSLQRSTARQNILLRREDGHVTRCGHRLQPLVGTVLHRCRMVQARCRHREISRASRRGQSTGTGACRLRCCPASRRPHGTGLCPAHAAPGTC